MTMSVIQSSFDELACEGLPGDQLMYGDSSSVSRVIQWFGRSRLGHGGIVVPMHPVGGDPFVSEIFVAESLAGGPEFNYLRRRVLRDYPKGNVWWLVLKDELRMHLDVEEYWRFIFEQVRLGKKYDWKQAAGAAMGWENEPDLERLFCSEYQVASLQVAGGEYIIPRKVPASETQPADLAEFAIWEGPARQLTGRLTVIPNFNTIPRELMLAHVVREKRRFRWRLW